MTVTRRFVFQGTHGNFATLVVENADKGPVMVHYRAPWAGLCMMLKAVLARRVQECAGRFLLVEINTDEEKALVRTSGVTSIAYLQIFRGGQPKADLRDAPHRYTEHGTDALRVDAIRLYRQGDINGARARLGRAAAHAPDDICPRVDRAKIVLAQIDD